MKKNTCNFRDLKVEFCFFFYCKMGDNFKYLVLINLQYSIDQLTLDCMVVILYFTINMFLDHLLYIYIYKIYNT